MVFVQGTAADSISQAQYLNVVFAHHLHLPEIVVRLPLQEIDLAQQALLMMLKFPNHPVSQGAHSTVCFKRIFTK
jgi:hypothetical protein